MKMRSVLIAGFAVLVASAAVSAADSSISAKAESGDGAFVSATLAPFGSFEWVAAPRYTRNAVVRHNAARALRGKKITVAKAQEVLRTTDEVRALLDQAVKTCKQNNKTGLCTGNQVKANVLLNQADAKLAAL